ncbi:tetratricopeptide repeat protein [Winogradskyella sp. UBA3174]|uniref:tetratricopeptide repeat protein n=1 Tax=Winogradskyella sp. UBA3174 TaxID=1947785 RepID=UPI0025E6DA9F|nr:tetratricopeptide repeat protein [Winogradskyella sp. UBA3174]|tara:strand:+ start:2465 stop:3235 length:771 start_codon:yes stop_codon:yes gene_type:complete
MKKNIYIILLVFIVVSCEKSISEADKKRVADFNEKAWQYRAENDLEKAKDYYSQAIEIDQSTTSIRYELIGVYVEQDSLDKAFELLEEIPSKQKETENYYQVKGGLYEYNGQKEKAIDSYKKAFELTKKPEVKNEMDLMSLVNYTMLETLAGNKDQAVSRLNKTLDLDWLSESNKKYLTTFRNEFEYYQGNGTLEFNPKNDIIIKTTNSDSIESILKENHINISGSSSNNGNDTTEIYISEKYRKGIEKLNRKNAP